MDILNSLTNVAKAGIAVAVSPVAAVADVLTLPSSAYDGRPTFGRTAKLFNAAGQCITEAVKPTTGEHHG